MVRLAIIGFGGYGWSMVDNIRKLSAEEGCTLVAAADGRLADLGDKAAQLRQAGVALYDDAMKMLAEFKGRCDAVYIATGINTHELFAVAAARAGYHVLLEKPPAATVQEVDRMLAALRENGRMCLVGFQAMHGNDLLGLRSRIAAGRLGRIRTITCRAGWPRNKTYYGRNNWAGKLKVGDAWVLDSPTANALAHQVANLLALAGDDRSFATPAWVRAELYAAGDVESHDTAAIEILSTGGTRMLFLNTHCSQGQFGPILEIEGESGTALWTMYQQAAITYADGTSESFAHDPLQVPKMLTNFIQAVRGNDASLLRCPLETTRNMVLALDGAHESSGRVNRIDAPFKHKDAVGTGEERTIVDGLDQAIADAAAGRCLFSDLPTPPAWAVKTPRFSMSGYEAFPVRFGR